QLFVIRFWSQHFHVLDIDEKARDRFAFNRIAIHIISFPLDHQLIDTPLLRSLKRPLSMLIHRKMIDSMFLGMGTGWSNNMGLEFRFSQLGAGLASQSEGEPQGIRRSDADLPP